MKNTKSTLFFVLTFFFFSALYAIPAIPYPITVTQPDGKELTVMLKGDERIHWHESMDGYTLLYNKEAFLTYAYLDDAGNLQPSEFIATAIENRNIFVNSFLNTIDKNLFYSEIQTQLMKKIWEIEDNFAGGDERALSGQYKTLCAFVQFPDKEMKKTISQFEGLMNQLGYTGNGTGSVRDFFRESSYGKFDLIITLCGIYTAPKTETYYAGDPGDGTANCPELARWLALQVAAEPDINFADYDSNNNGKVDGFHFIFAGVGQETGTCNSCIWSHMSIVYPAVTKNGKKIDTYSCSPELYSGSTITTVGVIAHEMSHAFGAPDFYDTNYQVGGQYTGTGKWDLMADGSWNGSPGGNCPAHHNMYTKVQFGWVTPYILTAPTTIPQMPYSTESPAAFRINTGNGNEHYLLENRQKIKFDYSVPGNGLIIYHVHNSVGSYGINNTHPQKMYPVCASSVTPIPGTGAASVQYGNINSAGCPFPGTSGNSSFDENSTPRMFHWTNTVITGKPITNITNDASTRFVSFDFMEESDNLFFITTKPNASDRGTTTGTGWYTDNSSITVSATPKADYKFSNWTESGNIVSEAPNYTFTIFESAKLVANFTSSNAQLSDLWVSTGNLVPAFNTNTTNYTVTVSKSVTFITISCTTADQFATVEGAGVKTLEIGNNIFTITVTADDKITTKQYTVNVIRENENKYTITSSVEDNVGGTITPNGETIVSEGANLTFTITPFDKYKIFNVLVNNENKGDIETYTFENIKSDGTIHAIFIEDVGVDGSIPCNILVYSNQNCVYIKNKSNITLNSVEITDMMGRIVYKKEISNEVTNIPLCVVTGIYHVKLFCNDLTIPNIYKILIIR
ncbi:MAG: M6 family metalloprotease domain-containing protein [Bacteroidales bacterium]|jgi:M6 family metalloprotease-like protein|nr:M6 family metalloprotease domain-containing protein [Bacteroidales bacterium]